MTTAGLELIAGIRRVNETTEKKMDLIVPSWCELPKEQVLGQETNRMRLTQQESDWEEAEKMIKRKESFRLGQTWIDISHSQSRGLRATDLI